LPSNSPLSAGLRWAKCSRIWRDKLWSPSVYLEDAMECRSSSPKRRQRAPSSSGGPVARRCMTAVGRQTCSFEAATMRRYLSQGCCWMLRKYRTTRRTNPKPSRRARYFRRCPLLDGLYMRPSHARLGSIESRSMGRKLNAPLLYSLGQDQQVLPRERLDHRLQYEPFRLQLRPDLRDGHLVFGDDGDVRVLGAVFE